jgi:hypothetical protein
MNNSNATQYDSLLSAGSKYEKLQWLNASAIETEIGGNTLEYSPARSLHTASEMVADAYIDFAKHHTIDGEDCGAAAKRQLTTRLNQYENDAKFYLQSHCQSVADETVEEQTKREETENHFAARFAILHDLTNQASIAGDYSGFLTLRRAADLGELLTEGRFPGDAMFDEGFDLEEVLALKESSALVEGDEKYTGPDSRDTASAGTAPSSRVDLPAFKALFKLAKKTAGQVHDAISLMDDSQGVESTESGQYVCDSLVSIYNAILEVDDPMRSHMQEMYGIAPNEEPSEDASKDEEMDEAEGS